MIYSILKDYTLINDGLTMNLKAKTRLHDYDISPENINKMVTEGVITPYSETEVNVVDATFKPVKEETKVDKFNINKDSEDDFELEEEFENFKKTLP